VRDLDPVDMTMTIEAGGDAEGGTACRSRSAGVCCRCRFPPKGRRRSAGVLAVNAGGNNTVRYGNARDLVLGLEAVLPDGTIWNGLRRLRKDNTGICLRQLFVGSEGTLGIITAAVLKLAPANRRKSRWRFAAVQNAADALELFARFQAHDAASISAVRAGCPGLGTSFVLRHIPNAVLPAGQPGAILRVGGAGHAKAERRLAVGRWNTCWKVHWRDGTVVDAAIAESETQRAAIWRLREEHSEAQKREGASVKNDVSVPVSKVAAFIEEATVAWCRR